MKDIELFLPVGSPELCKLLAGRSHPSTKTENETGTYWNAAKAGFQGSSLFEALESQQKIVALRAISQQRLSLALAIEEMGMSYCASMNLMSQSREEKIGFAMMNADEARHFLLIQPHILSANYLDLELFRLVREMLESEDRISNIFHLQVLLEGFGLKYYSGLAETTDDRGLKDLFSQIVKDEAFHHGLGIVLFNECKPELTSEMTGRILDLCEKFVRTISGEGWISKAIGQARGSELTKNEQQRLYEETNWRHAAQARLNAIKLLIQRNTPPDWLSKLESKRVFDV